MDIFHQKPYLTKEQREGLARQFVKDNFYKLSIGATFAFLVQLPLVFGGVDFCDGFTRYIVFEGLSLIFIPVIWQIHRRSGHVSICAAKTVQYFYLIFILSYGVYISLADTSQDFTYILLGIVFCVTSIIYMEPLETAGLLLCVYLPYAILMPAFNADSVAVTILRINVLIFLSFAWLQNYLTYRIKANSFLTEIQLCEKNKMLEELINKDTMTGLLTHEASFQKLSEEISRAENTGKPLSLILIDIDDFKLINDKYGHLTGDKVLKELARLITATVRKQDIVGRYGGEEFIIIMPDTDIATAKTVADAMSEKLWKIDIIAEKVTFSGGISQYAGESLSELIFLTDKKLYSAKGTGKNRFVKEEDSR